MAVKNKIFLPTLISSVDYQPVRTLPHIYFYNGLKDCEQYYIQHYPTGSTSFVVSTPQEKFPYFDYYDGLVPTTGSNSLLFFNETPPYGVTPTASLYTEYWDKYVSLLYNPRTRLINASAIIPLADYFEMELNDIVQWRGNYYHLRAINDYNLKDGTCNIQLLGPIIRDVQSQEFDCVFTFSSSLEGITPTTTISPGTTTTLAPTTTTTVAPTTTTISPTTTTLAPTTTTTTSDAYSVEYLMVAGGGGGGSRHAGGGGAGGFLSGSLTVSGSTALPIVVGAGGTGKVTNCNYLNVGRGGNGNNTTFFGLRAHGGGAGGGGNQAALVGGSGGGGFGDTGGTGAAGSGSQGNTGGNGRQYAGGGGGGASAVGSNAVQVSNTISSGGNGGAGKAWVNGNFYAGGGGGGTLGYNPEQPNVPGIGGIGGGANGDESTSCNDAPNGTPNTGGGGGGASGYSTSAGRGGDGGSGIVIIRYSGAQRGLGGQVTSSGSYTYHTFTASGDFTPNVLSTTTSTTTVSPTTTTTTLVPTTTTTSAPTTTTTTSAYYTFTGCGRGSSVGNACSDANNNRTLYSDCSFITTGCTIYTDNSGTLLTGYTNVFIDAAVWDINSSTGVITGYSSTQC